MDSRSSFRWTGPAAAPAIKNYSLQNEILLALPQSERAMLFSKLECVPMEGSDLLAEMGEAVTHVYFVNDGLASVLGVTTDNDTVEIGMIGKEGFVGLPILFGLRTGVANVVAQLSGTALRIGVSDIAEAFRQCPELETRVNRYSLSLSIQGAQLAACNQFHEVEERVARWLLMCNDRVGTDEIAMTHEALGQLLGIRRPSVSDAVGMLERAQAIQKNRRAIKIVGRKQLEDVACECYEAIVQQDRRCRREWQEISL